jgi:hypothetical protein
MPKLSAIPVVVASTLVLASCGSDMTIEQKYEHLRDVANKGADAHFVLLNENKPTTREVCEQHYKVFVPQEAPQEYAARGSSPEWRQLSLDYFIDSCVKGEPRVIQTRSSTPTPAPSTTSAGPASQTSGGS